MSQCPKCHGTMIDVEVFCHREEVVIERRCVNCGNREWPEGLKELRALNRAVYLAKEKTRHSLRPQSKGYYGAMDE